MLPAELIALAAPVKARVLGWAAKAVAPRKRMTVSEHADAYRVVSSKGSPRPGKWRTDANPILREPMDALSKHSPARTVVMMFPVQIGKTETAVNFLGYVMDHNPGPVMVCLPGEVSMTKWIDQKLQPAIDESEVMKRALTSMASRDASNRRAFKDFIGGQLYIEHAGNPSRLKSTTVRDVIVDELDEFAASLDGAGDPVDLLKGRTSAFAGTSKTLFISTPQIRGVSRIEAQYEASDQRRYHVPCPECGHEQPLQWSGLHWSPGGDYAWYVCRECGCTIDEHNKPAMLRAGRWVAEHPDRPVRGYTVNCLYYPIGLGPRWAELAQMWIAAQKDPAKLQVFVNDRLAETWEDPAMKAVRHNVLRDRAEPYRLRTAPEGVLAITAGVDTQDDRLEVHIVGWGRGMTCWVIDYAVLPGDPALEAVWLSLVDLINRPIIHECGAEMVVEATAIDTGGHRGEQVKTFVRSARIRRPMAIFGAVANNAPAINRGKQVDVKWNGKVDPRGLLLYQVGTVGIKHLLYSRVAADGKTDSPEKRLVHVSDELPPEYFTGLVGAETYNPARNRFEKKSGARNEPLDTWVYAYAAALHPQLRLHRYNGADWDRREARLLPPKPDDPDEAGGAVPAAAPVPRMPQPAALPASPKPRRRW